MKLVELIKYLRNTEGLENLYKEKSIRPKSEESLLIYMKDELDINSDIYFFEGEETDDDLVFEKNGITYVHLLPIDLAMDFLDSYLEMNGKEYSDLERAQRLLEYRINDA